MLKVSRSIPLVLLCWTYWKSAIYERTICTFRCLHWYMQGGSCRCACAIRSYLIKVRTCKCRSIPYCSKDIECPTHGSEVGYGCWVRCPTHGTVVGRCFCESGARLKEVRLEMRLGVECLEQRMLRIGVRHSINRNCMSPYSGFISGRFGAPIPCGVSGLKILKLAYRWESMTLWISCCLSTWFPVNGKGDTCLLGIGRDWSAVNGEWIFIHLSLLS